MWIARDEDGELCLYDAYPKKQNNWFSPQRGYSSYNLDERLFPEVTFENSPNKVKLELVEEDIIEKACKWLDDNLYTTYDMFNNTGVDSVNYHTVEEFIKEFRKAMKNENSI